MPSDFGIAPATLRRGVHDHWRLFTAEGVVLVLLGIGAMAIPLLAGLAATIVLGWVLLMAGLLGLASSLRARRAPGFTWSLLSAIVALLAGLVLVAHPLAGLLTLTYVVAAYFLVDGVLVIAMALSHRRDVSGRWELMLINGLIDLVLAAVILSGMPGSFLWVIGLLVGIDLVFGGISLIGMAMRARHASP